MKRSKFSRWLDEQTERNDPIGDLARDAHGMKDSYNLESLHDWVRYLERYRADDDAFVACGQAWVEFYRCNW